MTIIIHAVATSQSPSIFIPSSWVKTGLSGYLRGKFNSHQFQLPAWESQDKKKTFSGTKSKINHTMVKENNQREIDFKSNQEEFLIL